MSQALRPTLNSGSSGIRSNEYLTIIQQETRDRTVWSCYIMDRLLSCGKNRPTIFDSAEMLVPLPMSEADYAFGEAKEQRRNMTSMTSDIEADATVRTTEHYFTLIIQGVDIWATLSKWASDGGRRQFHGPNDCPWKPTSAWNKINRDLELWRDQQDERVKYSQARLTAHIHRGQSEAFALINLLYYLW